MLGSTYTNFDDAVAVDISCAGGPLLQLGRARNRVDRDGHVKNVGRVIAVDVSGGECTARRWAGAWLQVHTAFTHTPLAQKHFDLYPMSL